MKVLYSPNLGRYLVADKAYTSDELIFEETAFAVGPKQSSPIVCLGCYKPLKCDPATSERCPKCKWPLCLQCENSADHAQECQVFVKEKVKFYNAPNLDVECIQLDCITPLRILLRKESDPERWDHEVEPMECHEAARRENHEAWNADLVNVAQYLRGPCKLSRFSADLIMKIIGILQVNSFEAKTPQGYSLRCIFPQIGMLAHSCVPNTNRIIHSSNGYRIQLRASVDVEKDEQLSIAYTYILDGTAERQQHMKNGKYFTCYCARCSDPTELGTYYSSIKCKKCDSGYLSTLDPFDDSSAWKCDKCEFVVPSSQINSILDGVQYEVKELESMPYNNQRLECTERLCKKYQSILHSSHYIQTNLQLNLIQMYGRVKGYELDYLPDYLLEHKVDLCRRVLKLLGIFEPGSSRLRATILYELYAPLVNIAGKLLSSGLLTADEYKIKLKEACSCLLDAVQTFEKEDSVSLESSLAVAGRKRLEEMAATMLMFDTR